MENNEEFNYNLGSQNLQKAKILNMYGVDIQKGGEGSGRKGHTTSHPSNDKKTITVANTKENNARVKALKKIAQTQWTGTTVHDDMDKCLRALNLQSNNSGHYNPIATRINGLTGWYMINQDGSIFCEARVIKENEKQYKIEYMTNKAWYEFENLYDKFIDESEDKKDN